MAEKKRRKFRGRTPMPHQDAQVRAGNFKEVALGYSREQAMIEAERCLQCKKPTCQDGCPVNIDIRGSSPRWWTTTCTAPSTPSARPTPCPRCAAGSAPRRPSARAAASWARSTSPWPSAAWSATWPTPTWPQSACEEVTDLSTCALERDDIKVACIGSGPSSLTVAGYLAGRGIKVDVFEALHEPGGVLVYGIPEFRLPKSVVGRELEGRKDLGVTFHTNWVGGKTITIKDLQDQGYNADLHRRGRGLPRFLNVPGENLVGVFSANEYLTRVNLGRAYEFPNYDTPAYHARKRGGVWARATWPWTPRARPCAWAPTRSPSSTAAARTRCPPAARRSSTPWKRASGSAACAARSSFHGDDQGRLKALTVQKMELGEPDDSGRCSPGLHRRRDRADQVRHGHHRRGHPAQPHPARGHPGPGTEQVGLRPGRTRKRARPRSRTCSRAATSSPARPRSSRPWAQAARPPRSLPSGCCSRV